MASFDPNMLAGGIGGIFSGLFGDSGKPFKEAEGVYRDFLNQGKNIQNPFYNMGVGAIPQFQDWLSKMKDPTGFINNMMNQYQESPWAKFQQQQAQRTAQNMGSASGLTGSTPLTQFAEQNARDISSQDMNQWLQNVLGINTQYGAGVNSMISGGQNAANSLTNMIGDFGKSIAEARYGKEAGKQQDQNNLWGGLISTGAALLPLLL